MSDSLDDFEPSDEELEIAAGLSSRASEMTRVESPDAARKSWRDKHQEKIANQRSGGQSAFTFEDKEDEGEALERIEQILVRIESLLTRALGEDE